MLKSDNKHETAKAMKIKSILFDFGGVIYMTPDLKWMKRWKNVLGIDDAPEILELVENPNESEVMRDICLGRISEESTWEYIAEKWHIKPQLIHCIRQSVFSKRQLNKPMVDFIQEMHQSYQTGILSNAGDQTRHLMEEVLHLDSYVDDIIISAEEGLIKPDKRIFQIAMDRVDTTPDTTIFLDDYLVNVEAAREFGMKAVHFINNEQAFNDIRAYLEIGGS